MDGLVATNTTVHRPVDHPLAREEGGLSGAPLRALSTSVIRRAYARAADRLPIVGVGGIFTGQDAYEKIRAGASLIQLYTGLIFEGPSIVRRIGSDLRALLARDGFQSLAEAVGADVRPSPAALSWSES
jgi:dihydroorotate dehydrogenase